MLPVACRCRKQHKLEAQGYAQEANIIDFYTISQVFVDFGRDSDVFGFVRARKLGSLGRPVAAWTSSSEEEAWPSSSRWKKAGLLSAGGRRLAFFQPVKEGQRRIPPDCYPY